MILIPLRHENMQGRRWPIITFALIALNFIAFLGTHWTIEAQQDNMTRNLDVPKHLIILAATHPDLQMSHEARAFVDPLAKKYPDEWKELSSPLRRPEDEWDAGIREQTDFATLQAEMDSLCQQFEEFERNRLIARYGFVPAHPTAISYLTANFLHAGWLHLIGNMWFLWLAGFILEENWGRVIYSVFYLIAGAAALQFHGWMYPGSLVPLIGASGAVAALMGAFLVRFPKLKIEMAWFLFFVRIRFKAPAWCLLPLWGLMEVFYGSLFGEASGVAHWAHVGGFLFGMLAAVVIHKTGLEQQASAKIEEKVGSWSAHTQVVQAQELVEQGKVADAITKLRQHVAGSPDDVDALTMLAQLSWRNGDVAGHQSAILRVCQLHLKAGDKEAAWRDYEEFQNTGGQNLPAGTWIELCRYLEEQQNLERAVSEYEKLAAAWPNEKQSILALIGAGRLSLKRLNRPTEALKFYQAAAASPVPHLDWETNIQSGIAAANAALSQSPVPAGKSFS